MARTASILVSTAVALAIASPAYAQAAGNEEQFGANDDIVVTAQRTESLASKTPVALSAVGGDELRKEGVTDPTGLDDEVPSLSIVRNNGLQITIRGVTSSDNTEKGDPSAAFLLDGVYIARPQAQEVSFFDVARVEVLRGPQGTLYGRNTTAGVVNVITNRPGEDFEAAVNATYGNYETIRADAMINVPVSDMFALRFAGAFDRRDNYLTTLPGDPSDIDPFKKTLSFRGQALVKFSEDANLLLRGDYSTMKGVATNGVLGTRFYAPLGPTDPVFTSPAYIAGQFSTKELQQLEYPLVADMGKDNHTWGADAELNWDFGPLALTYLGSYRELERDETNALFVGVAAPFFSDADVRQISQELRFATTGAGPLKAQFGGYYFNEKSSSSLIAPGFAAFISDPTKSESYAVFGQATYSLTDVLRLTAGARYSHDKKSRVGTTTTGPFVSPNNATAKSDKVTWRFGVDYDLNDRSLLYGVVSTGYKAGGFNGGCSTTAPNCPNPQPDDALFYDPETLTSYEIGLKTRFAGNAVRLNASAFYYDYANLQVTTLVAIPGQGLEQITNNAAAASVKGLELEADIRPSPRNRVKLAFAYLDAQYDNYFPFGPGTLPDFEGRQLDRAPKVVVSAGYNYSYPFESGASLEFSAQTRLSDEYFLTVQTLGRQYRQPSYTRTDVSLTFNAPDERFYVQAFANNLENDVTVNNILFSGAVNITTGDPRTYGVRAGVRF